MSEAEPPQRAGGGREPVCCLGASRHLHMAREVGRDMTVSYPPSQDLHGADPVLALWNLLAYPTIDPVTLARAIGTIIVEPNLDWRTLQLVKEGWEALEESIKPGLLNDSGEACRRS